MDTIEKSDEELIKAYQDGEDGAMGEIFRRYQKRIFNFAMRFLGQRADAEDVTTDVFLNLLKSSFSWDADAKFSTWLYTVARNACFSKLRRKKNVFSLSFSRNAKEKEAEWDLPDPATAGEVLHRQEIGVYIKKAIHDLPEAQKEVMILREYQDLSYEDISRITGQSLSNVKVLIFRAREELRRTLGFLLKEVKS